MITFDAFLYLLAGASLPVLYILTVSRWIESEDRKVHPATATATARTQGSQPSLVEKAA